MDSRSNSVEDREDTVAPLNKSRAISEQVAEGAFAFGSTGSPSSQDLADVDEGRFTQWNTLRKPKILDTVMMFSGSFLAGFAIFDLIARQGSDFNLWTGIGFVYLEFTCVQAALREAERKRVLRELGIEGAELRAFEARARPGASHPMTLSNLAGQMRVALQPYVEADEELRSVGAVTTGSTPPHGASVYSAEYWNVAVTQRRAVFVRSKINEPCHPNAEKWFATPLDNVKLNEKHMTLTSPIAGMPSSFSLFLGRRLVTGLDADEFAKAVTTGR